MVHKMIRFLTSGKKAYSFLLLPILLSSACSQLDNIRAPRADAELLWSVELNHAGAVISTLPPYDTIQLNVEARNVHGELLDADIAWISLDSSLRVDNTGLVKSKYSTTAAVRVMAKVHYNGVTLYRQSFIRVTGADVTPVPLQSLSLQFDSPEQAFTYPRGCTGTCGPNLILPAKQAGADGEPVKNMPLTFYSRDSTVAIVNRTTGQTTAYKHGKVWMVLSAYAYGVGLKDSVQLYVPDFPLIASVATMFTTDRKFLGMTNGSVQVAVGGTVGMTRDRVIGDEPVKLVFLDSAAAASAFNGIYEFEWTGCVEIYVGFCRGWRPDGTYDLTGRYELKPTRVGTYKYRIPAWNYEGEIVVRDPPTLEEITK